MHVNKAVPQMHGVYGFILGSGCWNCIVLYFALLCQTIPSQTRPQLAPLHMHFALEPHAKASGKQGFFLLHVLSVPSLGPRDVLAQDFPLTPLSPHNLNEDFSRILYLQVGYQVRSGGMNATRT